MYQFNLYAIPNFLTAFYLLILGFIVFSKNKNAMSNITFALLCLSAAVWQFGFAMEYLTRINKTAIFWNRFVYFGVSFISPTMYHFSVSFLNLKKQKKLVYFFYFLAIMSVFLSRSNYFISGLREYFWGYYTEVGILHHPFLIIWFILGIIGLINLFKGYRAVDFPVERQNKKYIFLALMTAFIGVVDFLPAYGVALYPFGFLFVIACLSFVAHAIIKYRLMDITVTITRTGIFVAVYTLVLGLPFLLLTWGKDWLTQVLGLNWWAGPLVLLTILATAGPFFYIYLQKRAEAILLREQLRYRETLRQAAREMARIHNLKKLLRLIAHIVTKTVGISHSAIYLFNPRQGQFCLEASRNLKKEQLTSIDKKNPLVVRLQKHREPLVYEEVRQRIQEKSLSLDRELDGQMRVLNAAVIVPGFLKDNFIGLLILGDKRSGKIYSQEDLNTFSLLANQAALAVENALLYENIEEQVRQRTKELVEVQKQLIHAEKLATMGTLAGGEGVWHTK